nr:hypothetical protein [Tanacetum cinerariifolium]
MPDFHHYDDARDIWMAVKVRFGGNEESKKMRKTLLKQQFTEFSVTEEKGLHKGYDRFQKILSQLNQVQARPDNDDINMKSLELDVRISHNYGVKAAAAPIYSAFVGASSFGSKPGYSDQQSIVPIVSQTSGRSDNIMECVLHSFVAENDPDQDMIYEDFDQVDRMEMEALDLKWQLARLSLRINRFEKKAGRKMNYNNKQPARFDRRKARCYKCLQLGHFARECKVKTVDDKDRYYAYKVTKVKTDRQKTLVSVDSMVNWSDHEAENKSGVVENVYRMMAGLNGDHAAKGAASVSDAAAEFVMMRISPQTARRVSTAKEIKTKKEIDGRARILTKISLGSTSGIRACALRNFNLEVKVLALMAFSDSESLDKLAGSQITDTSKKGLGYHAVSPPHLLIYNGPTKLDLSYSGLDEFKEPEFKGYDPRDSKQGSNTTHDQKSNDSKENYDDSFVKEQVSKDTSSFVESLLNPQNDDKGFFDSGCSRNMTRNIAYLSNFKEFDEGYVTFWGEEHMVKEFLVGNKVVHKELGDRMERAATTASSLEVEQDNGSGPRCQDTILGDVEAQTRFEVASKQFDDPPLSRVNILGCGDDNIKLK